MLFEKELAGLEDDAAHCLEERTELLPDDKLIQFLIINTADMYFERQCIERIVKRLSELVKRKK